MAARQSTRGTYLRKLANGWITGGPLALVAMNSTVQVSAAVHPRVPTRGAAISRELTATPMATRFQQVQRSTRPPGDDVPLLAILAIYAAHQAILTGRRAFWGLAIELAAAAQKPISDRAIPARAEAKENLSVANSDRSSVAKERDVEILEEIRKRIEKGVKPHNLASILARKKWRNAGNKKSESIEPVLLSRNHIQAILKTLKAEHPDVFRSTAAPKRTTRARKP